MYSAFIFDSFASFVDICILTLSNLIGNGGPRELKDLYTLLLNELSTSMIPCFAYLSVLVVFTSLAVLSPLTYQRVFDLNNISRLPFARSLLISLLLVFILLEALGTNIAYLGPGLMAFLVFFRTAQTNHLFFSLSYNGGFFCFSLFRSITQVQFCRYAKA